MKDKLAEKLLAKVMSWDGKTVGEKLVPLELLAKLRYDYYAEFNAGTKFLGSLSRWLDQFKQEEREKMFEFVEQRLIFISMRQMNYLIALLNNMIIKKIFYNKAAKELGIKPYMIHEIETSDVFIRQKRQALFIGLSDGAHIDIVRRTGELDNEQVLTNYSPDEEKIGDIQKELEKWKNQKGIIDNILFSSLFLIDDFTASGKSFIRKEGNDYHGKLKKIVDKLDKTVSNSNFSNLFEHPLDVYLCFCIATRKAMSYIEQELKVFLESRGLDFIRFHIEVVLPIEDLVAEYVKLDTELMDIIKDPNYWNVRETIDKDSFKKGDVSSPWLGFDGGALPLVLYHNTPNNSLTLLWQQREGEKYKSLFPRINRH